MPTLHFLGDTQRTFLFERLIGREQNDRERKLIMDALSRENSDGVIFLGDLVSIGALPSQWREFDRLIAPLTEKKTPLYTVYGNHDYFFDRCEAEASLMKRFPLLESKSARGNIAVIASGNIRIVLLDSNRAVLTNEEWEEQKKSFLKILNELDNDPSVKAVLAALHHPPYTNSRKPRDSKAVRLELVPIFMHAKKTRAFFSGHCHAYERFSIEGKTFVVSGGGGGSRAEILPKEEAKIPDLYAGKPFRPFHYLRCELSEHDLSFTVIGLDKGEAETREIDRFTLSLE